jgi:hypothetical protein
MNRILGLAGEDHEKSGGDDEAAPGRAFNLGDENANPDEILHEAEHQSAPSASVVEAVDEGMQEQPGKTAERKATREKILWAVDLFIERLAERKKEGTLNSFDVLRLRALLMIVAAAGWAGKDGRPSRSAFRRYPRRLGHLLLGRSGLLERPRRRTNAREILEAISSCCRESLQADGAYVRGDARG